MMADLRERQRELVKTIIKLVSDRFDIEYEDIYDYIKMKINLEDGSVKNGKIHRVNKITLSEDNYIFFDMRTNCYYDSEKRKTDFVAVE